MYLYEVYKIKKISSDKYELSILFEILENKNTFFLKKNKSLTLQTEHSQELVLRKSLQI